MSELLWNQGGSESDEVSVCAIKSWTLLALIWEILVQLHTGGGNMEKPSFLRITILANYVDTQGIWLQSLVPFSVLAHSAKEQGQNNLKEGHGKNLNLGPLVWIVHVVCSFHSRELHYVFQSFRNQQV